MPFGELSDEELLAKARDQTSRDRDALINELFERHYERVARWCLRFAGSPDAADDLAQDVFVRAHRYLWSFKGTSRFSTWLYTIVRNESFNRLQRAGPPMDNEEVLADVASLDAQPDELTDRGRQGARLQEFLSATLEPMERMVFTLHYGDEMSLDAITRLLKLENASGAKAYIVSARRKLAKSKEHFRPRGETL
jgi:RNA polymerase sigma-70 factor, ECF subfamily